MDIKNTNPKQQTLLRLYAAYGACLALSFVPSVIAAMITLLLLTGVMIAAYILRRKSEAGSLIENHMIYLIRTFWIGALVAFITMTLGSFYLLSIIDNAPLQPCLDNIMSSASSSENLKASFMMSLFGPCMDDFMSVNFNGFLIGGMIAIGPVLAYFALRYVKGLTRALKGYRLAKPKSWL